MGRITKASFDSNFTVLHNDYLQDSNLGTSEIGMLTILCYLPENWNFSIEGLVHRFGKDVKPKDGKTKIVSALNALKENGYFRRIKVIDKETGRILDWRYEFDDQKHTEWIGEDICEYISEECPHSDFPPLENQPQSNKDIINTYSDDLSDRADENKNEEFEKYNSIVKHNIQYDRLCRVHDKPIVDSIKDIILDVLISKNSIMRIGNDDIPTSSIQKLYKKLEYKHITEVIERVKGRTIKNYKSYLRTSLYNAMISKKIEKPQEEARYSTDILKMYAQACDFSFCEAEMRYIESRLIAKIPYLTNSNGLNDEVELERCEYLRTLYLRMMAENNTSVIRNKYKYLTKMIDNDIFNSNEPKSNKVRTDISETPMKSECIPTKPSFDLKLLFEYAINNTPKLSTAAVI